MADLVNNKHSKAEHILDARMEYGYLLSNYLALANMVWVGFGAFFTLNTLLATGLGFSYSTTYSGKNEPFGNEFLPFVHVLIPVTGMFISLVAIYTARKIDIMQGLIVKRGREIEALLAAETFQYLAPNSGRFPVITTVGSLLFFTIWAGALGAAIWPAVHP